jgi:hypothetical protein
MYESSWAITSLPLYGSTALWTLAAFFSFLILYTVGRTPWTGDQPVERPLPIHRTTQTQNKSTQASMSQVGFEPTIPVFERVKTVHALDRAATAIGYGLLSSITVPAITISPCVNCRAINPFTFSVDHGPKCSEVTHRKDVTPTILIVTNLKIIHNRNNKIKIISLDEVLKSVFVYS